MSMYVPSFNLLGLIVPEKSVMKNFSVWKFGRKENEEIKGWISSSSLIPIYLIELYTVHVCTKLQSSRPHSSWEKCNKKFQFLKIGEKNEVIKGQKAAAAWFQYTWYIPPLPMCVPSFNLLGLTVLEKRVTKKFNVWKLDRKKMKK